MRGEEITVWILMSIRAEESHSLCIYIYKIIIFIYKMMYKYTVCVFIVPNQHQPLYFLQMPSEVSSASELGFRKGRTVS